MRFFIVLALFFLAFSAYPAPAKAGLWNDIVCFFTPCSGNGDEYYTRPNLQDGKTPHKITQEGDTWVPQDWIDARGGSATAVIDGFYQSGIITDQSNGWRTGAPIIEVGQGFMRLGDQDKRRVIEFMDYTYRMTDNYGGTILLEHKASGDSIGVYTKEGLQLQ